MQMMPTLSDPLNAQGFRSQRAEAPEDLWQPLWDTLGYATAGTVNELQFFALPKGQTSTLIRGTTSAAISKTFRDTSMDNASVIPTKLYKVMGLSIGFISADNALATMSIDRALIREQSYIRFRIVDKDILILPTMCIPELNPITGVSTTANATTITATAGGGGLSVPMYAFPIPVTLNPFENFNFTLNWDGTLAVTTVTDIKIVLQSFMRRPT